jgi:branched-subunit amino acid transport protein
VEIWLIMIAGGIITFGLRLSFIALVGERKIPATVIRILRFVPPAVLSAIILPEMIIRQGAVDLSPGNPRLLAGLAAALVAWRTKNIVWTIFIGMAVLLVLERWLVAVP